MPDRRPRLPFDLHPIEPISIPATIGTAQFIQRGGRLFGWSFVETTGAAIATADLWDGSGNNGQLVAPFALASGAQTRDVWGGRGIRIERGLTLVVTAGSIRGVVYFLGMSEDEILAQYGYEYVG